MESTPLRPRALVVYESMFGNTREVAEAVADGLSQRMDVDLCEVTQSTAAEVADRDLVVVGAPTHAFSLSRPSTRVDARRQGATHGSGERGLREWLAGLPAGSGQVFATFDTKVDFTRRLPGSAAHKATRLVRGRGYRTLDSETFRVLGTPGPLMKGEVGRARRWGDELARRVVARQVAAREAARAARQATGR